MYKILHEDASARAGKLYTMHGAIETPAFLPVATKGCVKTLSPEEVRETGTQALISNAFMLYLKPGIETIKKAGSLHKFMSWNGVLFTDSGGFQILKKDFLQSISDRGVIFKSPYDESRHLFTPEKCIEIQNNFGSDVAMVLDDCPPYSSDRRYVEKSVERTTNWAARSIASHKNKQLIFAIVQGGVFPELRRRSAEELVSLDFDGYGIGGLSIGEPIDTMLKLTEKTMSSIPEEKPRYLMGVGSPVEMLESISHGIDIFDSAFPTRNARHSTVYTRKGKYSIIKGIFSNDFSHMEKSCRCYACRNYTKAYISHLLKVHETLGMRLVTIHNIHFLQSLMADARKAIASGEFTGFKKEFEKSFRG